MKNQKETIKSNSVEYCKRDKRQSVDMIACDGKVQEKFGLESANIMIEGEDEGHHVKIARLENASGVIEKEPPAIDVDNEQILIKDTFMGKKQGTDAVDLKLRTSMNSWNIGSNVIGMGNDSMGINDGSNLGIVSTQGEDVVGGFGKVNEILGGEIDPMEITESYGS